MNEIKTTAAVLAVAFGLAAAPQTARAAAPENPAHEQLRAVREGVLEAVNKGDMKAAASFLHPNAVVTWQDARVSRGRDGVLAYLSEMLSGPNPMVKSYSVELKVDELSILHGSDTAIAFGSEVDHFKLAGGLNFDLHGRWSATMVREGGRWLIASLHASTNLFDNPLLNAAKRTGRGFGWGALVVGIALGMALARRKAA
ncbi:MAG TPA: nuclear transport factor 2 family protein [Elusimicrobiota bacterium]|nr:nuclear transport factor 2 family protein [Elusimicrobiota bacterium]